MVHEALKRAGVTKEELGAVAFTRGPGLMGSLLVGVSFAKGFARSLGVPMIDVNHLTGHVLAHFIKAEGEDTIQPEFPFLCLLVSGGNSQIILVKAYNDMEILGQTIDDAAGEAIDKCSKVMGLGYPGGPIIDKLARQGNPKAFTFSKPHIPGLDYSFSALVIVIYTMLGGFLAASTTDFIQSIIMTIALLIVVCYGIGMAGGLDLIFSNAASLPGYLSWTQSYDVNTHTAISYNALTIISKAAWGLGYFGMPHILLRFMAIDDHKNLVTSRRVATVWVVISMAVSVLIGIVALAMTKVGVLDVLVGADSETAIVRIAHLLSTHSFVFALVAGIILSGILASTMSTSDSQLLAASSSVSNDILTGFFGLKYDQKKLLNISRVCLVMIAIIGIGLAWNPNSSVFSIVSFAWAGFGASFGPLVLLTLYWKNANKWGALFGMLSGGLMVFIWHFIISPMGGVFSIYELLPAFVLSLIVNVVVSILTGGSSKAMQEEFEAVKGMN